LRPLLLALGFLCFHLQPWVQNLAGAELVYIPRSWHNVQELITTAQEQTGIVHRLEVHDPLKKMVLYDNLTDLASVREAALEYYTYVLGLTVEWRLEKRAWVLRPRIDLHAPVLVNLPALEEMWKERLDKENLTPPTPINPLASNTDMISTPEGDVFSTSETEPQAPWLEEPLPSEEVSRQWVERALYMMGHWWKTASPHERKVLRRLWQNSNALGRVPLMALVLSGKLNFEMGADVALEDLKKRNNSFSMGPSEAELEALALNEASSLGTTEPPRDGSLTTLDLDDTPSDTSPTKSSSWNWPKRIISFAPKNWWQLIMGQRVDHPEEKVIPPPSPHVLERRKEARQVYENMSDELESKREASTSRREKH
jgi:hypothetical protein